MNTRVLIYTAIFGNRDAAIREPKWTSPEIDYLCFTDNKKLKSNTYTIIHRPPSDNPRLDAKRYKVLPHQCLDKKYDITLWLDGHTTLNRNVTHIFNSLRESDLQLILFRHHKPNLVYEANRFSKPKHPFYAQIQTQMKYYTKKEYNQISGLYRGGVLFRKHNTPEVNKAMNIWWDHIMRFSPRDQISLPVALYESKIKFKSLPNRKFFSYIKMYRHKK